jgi:hypothetical protein
MSRPGRPGRERSERWAKRCSIGRTAPTRTALPGDGSRVTSILIVVLSPAPSRSGSPDKSPAPNAATRVPHRDRLGRAHHARGARRDERRRGHNKPVGQGGEPVSDSETASQQRVLGSSPSATGSPSENRTAWPGQADGRHLAGGLSQTGVTPMTDSPDAAPEPSAKCANQRLLSRRLGVAARCPAVSVGGAASRSPLGHYRVRLSGHRPCPG